MTDWLEIHRGKAPLLVAFPHTGTEIPADIEAGLVSSWRARKDADWWVEQLYAFARDMGATTIRTRMSRTVIDVNRDPSGVSLYPGRATTGLCPLETFDGEPLYRDGQTPDAKEIELRKAIWFEPFHEAVRGELDRLRAGHAHVVLYDAHAIRSSVPRLFEGDLPALNLGTNGGSSCAPRLQQAIEAICADSGFSWVSNGRFKGGWTTRHYGDPAAGFHAVQMELACRAYLREPTEVSEGNWPPGYDASHAAPLRAVLRHILETALSFTDPAKRDPE